MEKNYGRRRILRAHIQLLLLLLLLLRRCELEFCTLSLSFILSRSLELIREPELEFLEMCRSL